MCVQASIIATKQNPYQLRIVIASPEILFIITRISYYFITAAGTGLWRGVMHMHVLYTTNIVILAKLILLLCDEQRRTPCYSQCQRIIDSIPNKTHEEDLCNSRLGTVWRTFVLYRRKSMQIVFEKCAHFKTMTNAPGDNIIMCSHVKCSNAKSFRRCNRR